MYVFTQGNQLFMIKTQGKGKEHSKNTMNFGLMGAGSPDQCQIQDFPREGEHQPLSLGQKPIRLKALMKTT